MIETDKGTEFGSQFHYHDICWGIGRVYIKPATRRLNGKVERSHRIDRGARSPRVPWAYGATGASLPNL